MKKRICFFCILCLLIAVLLSACHAKPHTYKNVTAVSLCYNGSVDVSLPSQDISFLTELWNEAKWDNSNGSPTCTYDAAFVCDGRTVSYHMECGVFFDETNRQSFQVTDTEKQKIAKMLNLSLSGKQRMASYRKYTAEDAQQYDLSEQEQAALQNVLDRGRSGWSAERQTDVQVPVTTWFVLQATPFSLTYHPHTGVVFCENTSLYLTLTEEERLTVNAIFGYEENAA